METLLIILGGAVSAGAIFGLKKIGATLFLSKYGAIINKTFAVADPIIGEIVKSYEGSTVQEAIQLVVTRVADSDISEEDVLAVSQYVLEKFKPELAAAAVLDPESEDGKVSLEIAEQVKALTDGASKEEIFTLARSAISLVI